MVCTNDICNGIIICLKTSFLVISLSQNLIWEWFIRIGLSESCGGLAEDTASALASANPPGRHAVMAEVFQPL